MSGQKSSRGKRKLSEKERIRIRSEMAERTEKYGVGGSVKTKNAPAKVTLPRVKILDRE